MWTAWVFSALWNLVSLPERGARRANSGLEEGNRLALIALLFPLGRRWACSRGPCGPRCATGATGPRASSSPRRPAVVGHTLGGTVRTPVRAPAPRGIPGGAELHPARDHRQREEPLDHGAPCCGRTSGGPWAGRAASRWRLRSRPTPPRATPARRTTASLWRLQVTGEVPGIDYSAAFEVPVFRTAGDRARRSTDADRGGGRGLELPADYRQPAGVPHPGQHHAARHRDLLPPGAQPGLRGRDHRVHRDLDRRDLRSPSCSTRPILFPIVFGA